MLYSNRRCGNRYFLTNYPGSFLKGLRSNTALSGRVYCCPAKGQPLQESFGVFFWQSAQSCRTASALNPITGKRMGGTTVECPSCVLRLDLRPSKSGKMKSEPQARRSSQRGLDPGTGGCVSQRIRVPLDTECSVSHAVTDAVRGLTSIYMIGLGLLCPEPCHPDMYKDLGVKDGNM